MTLFLRYAATSDVGRVRRDNQDAGYVGPHLLVVADGVGGAARGDIASSSTVEALSKLDAPAGEESLGELAATIHLAHDRLAEIVEAHGELDGTSTTLTSAVFDGSQLNIGHVGDSRGYLLRDGVLEQVTSDHSLVQSLVDEGRITEEEARVHPHRNLILKAIDSVHEPEPDLFSVPVQAGDRILFCSDGCSGVLDSETMASLMVGDSLEQIANGLVTAALEAGSSDNVTVIVAEVLDGETPAQSSPLIVGAAALTPHRQIPDDTSTGNLTETELEDLSTVPLDPEAIRYAPLPPPRRAWLRRLIALVVVVALLGGAGYGGYAFTQTRYFLAAKEGSQEVYLYQGVDLEVFRFKFYEAVQATGYNLSELGTKSDEVKGGFGVKDRDEALPFLKRACEQALESVEDEEPVSPFALFQSQRVPLDRNTPPDCNRVP